MDSPFALPIRAGTHERSRYRIRPRPETKIKTILDARQLFGGGDAVATVDTRAHAVAEGELALELTMRSELPRVAMEDRFTASWRDGIVASTLSRRVGRRARRRAYGPPGGPEIILELAG